MIAANSLSSAFANADQRVEWVFCRRLTAAEVLVDEAAEQRRKTHAATSCLVTQSPVLLGL